MKHGILLINLGTPQSSAKSHVRQFLREFLIDPRVIDLPALVRYILLYLFILPFRTPNTAKNYQKIWTEEGSPLMVYSQRLAEKLAHQVQPGTQVMLAMRYGEPNIKSAIAALKDCDSITILPLYPQYSSAASGSSIAAAIKEIEKLHVIPHIHIIRDFYHHPSFIRAQAAKIKPYINNHDYILFSYHGLPLKHLKDAGCKNACTNDCPSMHLETTPAACYRAQCFETTRLLAAELNLDNDRFSSSFQSRLGKTIWIKPYTDEILIELNKKGIRRLAISCPAFVADCLETLEEIGMQARHLWLDLGSTELSLIPCLNDDDAFVTALCEIIQSNHPFKTTKTPAH